MNKKSPISPVTLTDEHYEPAAEWLGGDAWVSPPPFTLWAPVCAQEAHSEQAATDWIPV
ncbi:hypothetical protein [Dokdonella sp.]|uniref:hypothetical protein n=1 Tax=Dokdonella sp. TaxID=2291710 RepID=UPI003C327A68